MADSDKTKHNKTLQSLW